MSKIAWFVVLVLALSGLAVAQAQSPTLIFSEQDGYGNANTFQVVLADFDGDGDLDAVFGNMDVEAELWWNNGDGTFRDSGQRFRYGVHGVGVGDFDADGDLDLFLARASLEVPSSVYLNDASGGFRLGEDLDEVGIGAGHLVLFDLEGDGDLDASLLRSPTLSALYVNDGSGHFEALGVVAPGLANWGDFDGDGDADALIAVAGERFFTWMNAGGGAFVRTQEILVSPPFFAGGSAVVDLDNDGDLDLVACGAGFEDWLPTTILLNNGEGTFTIVREERFLTLPGWITLGDFDGDGIVDVLASAPDVPDRIGLGDGQGGLIDSGVRLGTNRMPGLSAAGDLDADGDVDIFLCQYDPAGPNVVWINVTNE